MRFSTFFILACLGMAAVVSGMFRHSAEHRMHSADYRRLSSPDQVQIERDPGWAERSSSPQYVQPFVSPPPSVHYSFPGGNDDVNYDGSTDFDWSHFAFAIVLLAGGTLVCRRIFRGAAGSNRATQFRPPSPPTPPTAGLSRMCPRADCGRVNPSGAKFCRRCGTELSDV